MSATIISFGQSAQVLPSSPDRRATMERNPHDESWRVGRGSTPIEQSVISPSIGALIAPSLSAVGTRVPVSIDLAEGLGRTDTISG